MKRKLLLMLLCAALGLGAAQAEVYRVESEADVPADWAEKDTLRLTCIDTNRSDAMVLQSGGEAMMVDGGEGRYRNRVCDAGWIWHHGTEVSAQHALRR